MNNSKSVSDKEDCLYELKLFLEICFKIMLVGNYILELFLRNIQINDCQNVMWCNFQVKRNNIFSHIFHSCDGAYVYEHIFLSKKLLKLFIHIYHCT